MPVERRFIQGTYISKEAKEALAQEAKRSNKFPATVASEILERGARLLIRKAAKENENS